MCLFTVAFDAYIAPLINYSCVIFIECVLIVTLKLLVYRILFLLMFKKLLPITLSNIVHITINFYYYSAESEFIL